MKRREVLLMILIFLTAILASVPYALKHFRSDVAMKIEVAQMNWLASRSEHMLAVSDAIISASEMHDMKDGARAACSLLDDYILVQESVAYRNRHQNLWVPDAIVEAQERLYLIGYPESDLPSGTRRVIVPPNKR